MMNMIIAMVVVSGIELLRGYSNKKNAERQARLDKRREEFEVRQDVRRRRFEEYKRYIEENFNDEEESEEELQCGYTRFGEFVTGSLEYVMNYPSIEHGTVDVYDPRPENKTYLSSTYDRGIASLPGTFNYNMRDRFASMTVGDMQRVFY